MRKIISSAVTLAMLAGTMVSATGVMAAETQAAHANGVLVPGTYETVFDTSTLSGKFGDTPVGDAFPGWSSTWVGSNQQSKETNVNCITDGGKHWIQFYGAAGANAVTVNTPNYADGADWFAIEFVMSASAPNTGKKEQHCHDTILLDGNGNPFYSYAYADANDGFYPTAGERSFTNKTFPKSLGAGKEGSSKYTNGSSIMKIIVDNDATYDGNDAYAVTCVIDDNVISTHYYEGSVNSFGGISVRSINSAQWYYNTRYGDLKVYVGNDEEPTKQLVTYKYVYGDGTEIPSGSLPENAKMNDYADPGSYTATDYPQEFKATENGDLVKYTYAGGDDTITVTEGSDNVVTLKYNREVLPKQQVVVKAVDADGKDIKTLVPEADYNIDHVVSYAYPKYITGEDNKVLYICSKTSYTDSWTVVEGDNTVKVVYNSYEGDTAYYYEFDGTDAYYPSYVSNGQVKIANGNGVSINVPEDGTYDIEVAAVSTMGSGHTMVAVSGDFIDENTNVIIPSVELTFWPHTPAMAATSKVFKAGDKITVRGSYTRAGVDYILLTKTGDIPIPSATLKEAVWNSTDETYTANGNGLTVNDGSDSVVYGYSATLNALNSYSKFKVVATPANPEEGEAKDATFTTTELTNVDVVFYILSNLKLNTAASTVTAID